MALLYKGEVSVPDPFLSRARKGSGAETKEFAGNTYCSTKLTSQQRFLLTFQGRRACDSPPATVPTDISTTTSRPDLVLISESEITFLELIVPFNSPEALAAAWSGKSLKSSSLQLTNVEVKCLLHTPGHFKLIAIRTLSDISKQETK